MAAPKFKNPFIKWVDERMPIFTATHHSLVDYPTPKNLSYMWSFGSLAGIILVIMIVTGVFLAMNYTAHVDHAFDSIQRLSRDVEYGWLLRSLHMNGGSMFFLVVFIHLFRGMYYGSYQKPRELLWILGVVILLVMMATAFLGYVLPWGQMSYWAAKVIVGFFSAIPWVGDDLVLWLWGDFRPDNPTLNRFYALHYLLPFVLVGIVFLHLWALHTTGSNNPVGIEAKGAQDTIPFHPYYTVKDFLGLSVFLIIYFYFVFMTPDALGEPENYQMADPFQTPALIVPEWYFLPFYAILKAFTGDILFLTAKLQGVIAMFLSVILLAFLPWLDGSKVRSSRFKPVYRWFLWIFILDCILLGYVGGHATDDILFEGASWLTFGLVGQIATFYYFAFLLVIIPVVSRLEKPLPVPQSISKAVTKGGA